MTLFGKLRSRVIKYRTKDHGAVSVEFVLWMPIFFAIMMLAIDATVLFTSQSNYWSVSRDTARLVSRHALNEAQAEAYALQQASNLWTTPTTNVTIEEPFVTVSISAPGAEMSLFNFFGLASDLQINASVQHIMEPRLR